jgi:hypothetical protein
MARRKTLHHPEEVRRKIQASQLVNRLNSHALGRVKMEATQVRAAEVLLKKSLPDLTNIEFTGKFSGEFEHEHTGTVEVATDYSKLTPAQIREHRDKLLRGEAPAAAPRPKPVPTRKGR